MKNFLLVIALLIGVTTYSQQLSQVTFSYDGQLAYFTISSEQGVLIRISPEGQVLEFGSEEASLRNNNYYNQRLLPYPGRVEFYGNSDSLIIGKIKNIGITSVLWFGQYESKIKAGKLKSIGRVRIDYYDNFADKSLQGKIKSFNSQAIEYYPFLGTNEAYRGGLRSVGNTAITYYSSFDDRQIRGKLKSIGPLAFNWYTSFDINRSGLKSGLYRNTVNGVTYIMQ